MLKAVLFDLWDTLAYTPGRSKVREQIFRQLGEGRYEKMRQIFKEAHREDISTDTFIRRVHAAIRLEKDDIKYVRMYYDYSSFLLFDDTEDILKWLKLQGYFIGLISNCPSNTRGKFHQLGIKDYFDTVILSFEVGLMKPSKEIFDLALQELKVKPSLAVMVGDKLVQDMEGAKNARMRGILLDREGKHMFPEKIQRLTELKNML